MDLRGEALWAEQLELAQVPEGPWPGVYLLGVPSSRITFADQQKRAFNLVASLVASGRLGVGAAVACVGGGIGGITAAGYASQLGLAATVFEQHGDAMMLHQGSNRWIHPNLYDWPRKRWRTPHTTFPCMNWRAEKCVQVIAALRAEWRQLVAVGKVRWRPNTIVSSLARHGDQWALNGDSSSLFDAVILAVGFGEDRVREDLGCKPYWRDDDLHQRMRGSARVLVSGCGDGGLIDALRAIMIDFRHEQLLKFCELAGSSAVAEAVRSIELERPRYPDGIELERAYLALDVPSELDAELQAALKPDVHVTLNGTAAGPFDRGSSAINRFLVSRLIRGGRIDYLRGKVEAGAIKSAGAQFVVTVDGVLHNFDHVVLRHGPKPAAIDQFADVAATLQAARAFFRTYRDVADRSRQELWEAILAEASPAPKSAAVQQVPVDTQLVAYLTEKAHSLFKIELGALLPGAIVKRATENHIVRFVVEIETGPVGTVQLAFEGAKRVAIFVTRSEGGGTGATEIVDGATAELILAEMSRVVRNGAFIIAGRS